MEKDFHYHLTYAAARLAGLPEPQTIAYASQFVDDNNEGQFSIDGNDVLFPEQLQSGGGHYYPVMTQSLSPKSLNLYVQRYVYIPFHFLPGDNTAEIDGKRNPLCTTPNSANAKIILKRALRSANPYQTGIALHTFADTWSHQNFTGLNEGWNSVYPWYNIFKSIAPNIGHAEAGHSPDVVCESWTDHRLKGNGRKIDNRQRALDALKAMYEALRKFTGRGPAWDEVRGEFRKIIEIESYDERIRQTSDLAGGTPVYSQNDWIGKALAQDGPEAVIKPGFENTDWYRFHQAAKTHLAWVAELTRNL